MTTVAVLRGGVGDEHDVSLKTGFNVLRRLDALGKSGKTYRPLDVYIDRTGVWYVRGLPMLPARALQTVDIVFNALHGTYGEDGSVQRELERLGIPYTGSNAFASGVAMNKAVTKAMLADQGIRMPRHVTVMVTPDLDKKLVEIFRTFPMPSVIKPINSGSSVGVSLARSFTDLTEGVRNAFTHSKEVMIEEYIKGREATVGVIDGMRGKRQYHLPPVEIIVAGNGIFDYAAKYSGDTDERCPGNFSRQESEELQYMATRVHDTLGLRHYSRSDFIVSPRGVYFLEVNTLPGLTDTSLLPKSLEAVGISMDEFLDHVLQMALEKK